MSARKWPTLRGDSDGMPAWDRPLGAVPVRLELAGFLPRVAKFLRVSGKVLRASSSVGTDHSSGSANSICRLRESAPGLISSTTRRRADPAAAGAAIKCRTGPRNRSWATTEWLTNRCSGGLLGGWGCPDHQHRGAPDEPSR